jgi:hypothetical protein
VPVVAARVKEVVMGLFDDIEDIGEDIVDAAGDVVEGVVDAGSNLFEGGNQLLGIVAAGAALYVSGPGALIPAFIAGSVAGELLIKQRHMTDAERAFAESVFGATLPSNDRIVLTNLTGIGGREFVCPNAIGQAIVNLGDAYGDPVNAQNSRYPMPGKVFVHELTHVWQINNSSFVPGLVCEGIGNQLAGADYKPGDSGKPWGEYNLEQQGTIVDEWFAPAGRGPQGFRGMRPEHPFYRYVQVDVRHGTIPRTHPMVSSGLAVARVDDHLDVFWVAPDGSVGSQWWDAAAGCNWGDHAPFGVAAANAAQPGTLPAVVCRRLDQVDVFWVGPDGGIASHWWNQAPGSSWGDHRPFGIAPSGAAQGGSPVSAVGRTPDHLDVFWIGPDGAIGSTWWDAAPGCSWGDHTPFPITPPGAAQLGGLAGVSRQPEHLDVFWVGPDGGIGSTWWHGGAGTGWGDHQPFGIAPGGAARAGSPVVAVARTPDHLDVFWIGPDGGIGSTWWDAAPGCNWGDHTPFGIAPPGAAGEGSGLAVVSRRPDHLDVFWVGPDGAIGSMWWNAAAGMGWGDHTSFAITPPGAARSGSPVAAVARGADHLDVFWIGPDGAVASTWWDAAPGMGWSDHQPFDITGRAAAAPWSPAERFRPGDERTTRTTGTSDSSVTGALRDPGGIDPTRLFRPGG